jgi:hypothetical protein
MDKSMYNSTSGVSLTCIGYLFIASGFTTQKKLLLVVFLLLSVYLLLWELVYLAIA